MKEGVVVGSYMKCNGKSAVNVNICHLYMFTSLFMLRFPICLNFPLKSEVCSFLI